VGKSGSPSRSSSTRKVTAHASPPSTTTSRPSTRMRCPLSR
jgi:hypothetical protein